MMYQGMISISVGIMRVVRIAMKTRFLPRNWNFASVYPIIESKKRTDTVTRLLVTSEFKNQVPNGVFLKMNR
jgi:hypothetical protein